MSDPKEALHDFEEDEATATRVAPQTVSSSAHSASALGGFKDFCLKRELLRTITENGFEHPSEVQHQALPQAVLGKDILAQAKSGMGKTAVFVFALLEQIEKPQDEGDNKVQALILVHARELAYQIDREFKRFNKYLPFCTTDVFYGGVPEDDNVRVLENPATRPTIVVGTPGRINSLIGRKALDVSHIKWFVVDEFDRCLEDVKMRRDVQAIFMQTPRQKQVLMFSATSQNNHRDVARKFMNNPTEIFVDQQAKLTLHGLTQYYCKLAEEQKMRRLCDVLDVVEFNQCIIFTMSRGRAEALAAQLVKLKFPAEAMHGSMEQEKRLKVYESCKKNNTRIVVATDLFGRGIDINRVNLVIQFDMASDADSYLHRVGRAGRFGTKGLTVAFLTNEEKTLRNEGRTYKDGDVMQEVQERFEVHARELTDPKSQLLQSQYMNQ